MKRFAAVFLIQALTIPVVIGVFKILDSNKLAGVVAGALFVFQSLFLIYYLRNQKRPLSVWFIAANLLFVILPLFVTRLYYYHLDFGDYHIYGLSAPDFHKFSERAYVVVMFSSLVDAVRSYFKA